MDALEDIATLRAALAEREAELAIARAELTGALLLIAQYKAQLHKLRRMQFGRSSEALDEQINEPPRVYRRVICSNIRRP
ncbi:MAG TPA: hypothetical protein PLO16_14395, partial [Acidocella sp.]|nr:hypothetical protein [Acidocella sp.]